ncbi:hypothetical protein POV26_06455 [Aequorivita todarodis]|uniref:hypothetical protein n=1 Tax=Aequorivita todarodis TaxID=2036821 RepID=UPI0023507138|nr:hypothetical protein [Aequorivita todarodis]MDC8000670.1 hypothetical protein [Aequorivita todarodis]
MLKIKIVFLNIFCAILLSACNSSTGERTVEFAVPDFNDLDLQQIKIDHDICNAKCAVLKDESCYDRESGTAILYIPVPKSQYLVLTKQDGNTINFETRGGAFSPEYYILKVRLTGLERTSGSKLTINLDINSSLDRCAKGTDPKILGVKKKGSVITGHPPMQDCVPDVKCIDR